MKRSTQKILSVVAITAFFACAWLHLRDVKYIKIGNVNLWADSELTDIAIYMNHGATDFSVIEAAFYPSPIGIGYSHCEHLSTDRSAYAAIGKGLCTVYDIRPWQIKKRICRDSPPQTPPGDGVNTGGSTGNGEVK